MVAMNKVQIEENQKKLISIVIPAYNEQDNVGRVYEEVKKVFEDALKQYDFEIIFLDNHSTDCTFKNLEKLAAQDHKIKVAKYTRNYGFNKSLLTGYRLAKGDAAIQLDCDLQDSPEIFTKFVKYWEKGYDVVVGVREKRPEPKLILLMRKVFYRFLAKISDDNLIIDGGDFRLVDASILRKLRNIHDSTPYVRGLISTLSRNQISFPYVRSRRKYGKSKFPFLRLVGLAIDGIVSHSTIPLRLATFLGFALAGCALIFAFIYFLSKLIFGYYMPPGFATTVILELLSISINALLLGVIGEYLAKIHQQLRQVPITVIQKTLNFSDEDIKFTQEK